MLTPSQRKKVAEVCTGYECDVGSDAATIIVVRGVMNYRAWEPDGCHYRALVSKIAGLIRDTPSDEGDRSDTWRTFGEMVADNDIDGLESLAYELLEAE